MELHVMQDGQVVGQISQTGRVIGRWVVEARIDDEFCEGWDGFHSPDEAAVFARFLWPGCRIVETEPDCMV